MINLFKRQRYLSESWIKPRTLINLRWLAIAGQVVAIAVTDFILNFNFNVQACFIIIFFSCVINLTSSAYFRTEKRLSAFKTFVFLVFDLTQISLLLFFFWGDKQSLFDTYHCTYYCLCIFFTNNLFNYSWGYDTYKHFVFKC